MNGNNNFYRPTLEEIKKNSSWIIGLGIVSIILGTLAIMFAFTSTVLSVIFFGCLLLSIGVLEGVKSFTIKPWGTFLLHLILSVLFVVGGISIILYPTINAITLTLVLAAFLAVSGIMKMIFALVKQVPHKFWLFLNGALGLLLAILIWKQWPFSGLWVLGMFIGIDMIFTGWTWIMLALAARKSAQGR